MIPLIDIQLSTVPSLYTLSTTTDPPSGAPDNPAIPPKILHSPDVWSLKETTCSEYPPKLCNTFIYLDPYNYVTCNLFWSKKTS